MSWTAFHLPKREFQSTIQNGRMEGFYKDSGTKKLLAEEKDCFRPGQFPWGWDTGVGERVLERRLPHLPLGIEEGPSGRLIGTHHKIPD